MDSSLTKPLRYEKEGLIFTNEKEITLIAFLKEKRIEKKITKKYISNIIKNNDYWYSQIEMGKKDDHRRKFINRLDLINIISVIIFNAKNALDLERLYDNSENYIDNILKIVSYDQEARIIPLYEMINKNNEIFNSTYSENRLNDCLSDLNTTIKDFYSKCNPIEQDSIINLLNTLILNLSIEPILTLHYYGLPFCSFFTAQPKDERDKNQLNENVLKELDDYLIKYSKLICESDIKLIIKRLSYHLYNTSKLIDNPFSP